MLSARWQPQESRIRQSPEWGLHSPPTTEIAEDLWEIEGTLHRTSYVYAFLVSHPFQQIFVQLEILPFLLMLPGLGLSRYF